MKQSDMNIKKEDIQRLYYQVLGWFKRTHPMVIMGVVFLITFLMPSESGLWNQIRYSNKLREVKREKKQLQKDIAESRKQLDELQFHKSTLERYARERFQMKAEDEDLYILRD